MTETTDIETSPAMAAPLGGFRGVLQRLFGGFRVAFLPVLITYFCYGASAIVGISQLFFEKDLLKLSPAEVAAIGFWVALPWSTKMVAGTASDVYPIFGSRRKSYLLLGAACTLAGYLILAIAVQSKGLYLAAMILVTVGFMIQDVIADALSVEVARNDEEVAQIQTLGRMALLLGGILTGGFISGLLAEKLGAQTVFLVAALLPTMVMIGAMLIRTSPMREVPRAESQVFSPHKAHVVMAVGLGYALLGLLLESFKIPFAQEIVLFVSSALIIVLLREVGITRAVAVAAFVIFLFRAMPGVGQGYSFWAVDKLGFDQRFLGLLSQVSSILSLLGLIVFRKYITTQPVSFTLTWVVIAGTILSLPTIGLYYGMHEWLGVSARTLAFIDTTIAAPLGQLTMVPMLILIAKTAPKGAEATMFAIMASLMNLALSASSLFTRYLNEFFHVSQQDYSNLGRLMITATIIGLLPLIAVPFLKRHEAELAFSPHNGTGS